MAKKKKWYVVAREENRLCRRCREPVPKAIWKDPIFDHLCHECWIQEMELPHNPSLRLAR